jgi:hypothetical protein
MGLCTCRLTLSLYTQVFFFRNLPVVLPVSAYGLYIYIYIYTGISARGTPAYFILNLDLVKDLASALASLQVLVSLDGLREREHSA